MSDMAAREARVTARALDLEEIQREAGGSYVAPLDTQPPPGRPPFSELDKT